MRMATSPRKRVHPSSSLMSEVATHAKRGRIETRKRSGGSAFSSAFHGHNERYSFAHLAKVLVSGDRLVMLNAVDRLRGRSRVLAELAIFSSFQFVRLAAISHLTNDPEALIDIAKYCPYDDTRAAALDDLSSATDAVIEVACSSLFKDTRMEAVNMLTEPNALSRVASRSPNQDSRLAAMSKIENDSPALRKVAEESSYRSTRLSALKSLSADRKALGALLLESRHVEVRKEAAVLLASHVEDIEDVDTLSEVAKISPNQDARCLAIGRLWRHPDALRKIAVESRFNDAKSTALMLLSDMVSSLDDPDILADVAIMSPYQDCRAAAVERLAGQSNALLNVASRSKFRDARSMALDSLRKDTDALKNLARLSKYKDIRAQAHKIISNPSVFESELTRILG